MMPKTVARSLAERRKRGEKPQAIRAWWMLVNEPDAPAALRGAARAMRLLWHIGRGAASARPYLTVDEAVAVWQRAVAVGLAARKSADIERIVLDYGMNLRLKSPYCAARGQNVQRVAAALLAVDAVEGYLDPTPARTCLCDPLAQLAHAKTMLEGVLADLEAADAEG